ncbi:MAG: TIR domain-containing protein [Oscillospiraceae bacterium]
MSDYDTLKKLYDEIDNLIISRVSSDNPNFTTWHTKVERFLKRAYGEHSEERENFLDTSFTPIVYSLYDSDSEFIDSCANGLISTKAVFEVYLEELKESEDMPQTQVSQNDEYRDYSKVFIVHGHDEALKEAVARLVEKQSIIPIVLNEQANRGQTIIEKLEGYSNVGGAICLFTPDDEGHKKNTPTMGPRARQNVVFETGYFMGKLGRDKIVIISESDVELPSDMSGIVYTDAGDWKIKILRELEEMGYKIDYSRIK